MTKLHWATQAGFSTSVTKNGRILAVIVQPGGSQNLWHVLSIESVDAKGEAILDDHAHKLVGKYESVPDAFEAAESFARAWLKGHKSTQAEQCECVEIGEDPRDLVARALQDSLKQRQPLAPDACECLGWTCVGYPKSAYDWNDEGQFGHHPACEKYVAPKP